MHVVTPQPQGRGEYSSLVSALYRQQRAKVSVPAQSGHSELDVHVSVTSLPSHGVQHQTPAFEAAQGLHR
jgi:hypothetical protein